MLKMAGVFVFKHNGQEIMSDRGGDAGAVASVLHQDAANRFRFFSRRIGDEPRLILPFGHLRRARFTCDIDPRNLSGDTRPVPDHLDQTLSDQR